MTRLAVRFGAPLGLALVLGCAAASAQPLQPVPPLAARVTDLTGTLAPAERNALEAKLARFEAKKGAQLAVLIVPTTEPEAIEQYSIRVVEAWRLGREASDDGVLLLVAKNDRKLRIEVGRGLEGALTDLASNRIIDETIVPLFRAGDFAGGIDAGVDRMLAVVEGEELPPPDPRWKPDALPGIESWGPLALMALPFLALALRALLGPLGPFLAAGLATGLGWLATRQLAIALGFGLFTLFFGLALARRRHWSSGRRRGGWVPRRLRRRGLRRRRWRRRVLGRRRQLRRRRRLGELVAMRVLRTLRHLLLPARATRRRFTPQVLAEIEAAIGEMEAQHEGEICFAIETVLDLPRLWRDASPRECALDAFAELRVWDTARNNGVLIYVLFADHDVEIVADRAVAERVPQPEWEAVCAQMEEHFRGGRFGEGAVAGVRGVGRLLARHFPRSGGDANELSNRPSLL